MNAKQLTLQQLWNTKDNNIGQMQDKTISMNTRKLIPFPQNMHIFIAGAGGIGCQLIKILYKSNNKLTVLDYDIISQSNLNRQFCYRIQDIGKRKVEVLFQYFKSLNPLLIFQAQFGNLFDYDPLYFSQFDILISALDTHQARCYLNQMAIQNNIPMIDAGTSGYYGQSQCFLRHISECRMCRPQPTQSLNFAVCSIRGIPQRNIHCIHFALELYKEIKNLHKQLHKQFNQFHDNKQQHQLSTLFKFFNANIQSFKQCQLKDKCKYVFNHIFNYSVKQMNIQGVAPVNYQQVGLQQLLKSLEIKQFSNYQEFNIVNILKQQQNDKVLNQRQLPQSLFSYIFTQLLFNFLISQNLQDFDKDTFQHVLFIFAITNLRIYNFIGNPRSTLNLISYYQCKDLSGRIVPAIASTNSIASALQVLTILTTTQNKHKKERPKYISIKGYLNQHKIQSFLSQKPKQHCPYCSYLYTYAEIQLMMDTITWGQLEQFLNENFDNTLIHRDMRCGQYVIIRNGGLRPFHSNKNKFINFNTKLITTSKLDNSPKIVAIKYLPMHKTPLNNINSKQNTGNVKLKSECYTVWKFLLIHSTTSKNSTKINEKYIRIRKPFSKEEHEKEVNEILKMIKSQQQEKQENSQNSKIQLVEWQQPQIIEQLQKSKKY